IEPYIPGRRVKERALSIMNEMTEKTRNLILGAKIIRWTSGNTINELEMSAAAKVYKASIIKSDNSTEERRNLLRAYGAKVVLSTSAEKMPGAIKKAKELQKEIPGSFIPQQFENEANPDIHRKTTAVEILEQMEKDLDAFVC